MASLLLAFFLALVTPPWTHAGLILEEGYTVTTVIDGHKLKINPHAVLSRPGSSDLIVLDSSRSVFFTLQFPISQESVVNRLSGNGVAGISDGSLDSAQFNKPKSFAIDGKGNIYAADRINGTIRKITSSGVTTIAGGYSRSGGHQDGPAQNATFSTDFEVAFVPQECALLISDHGNQLIRHIALKPHDCTTGSQSGLGMVSFWVLGLGLVLSTLIGFAIGFVSRAYIPTRLSGKGFTPLGFNETWKHCLIKAAKSIQTLCFDMRSAIASSRLYSLLRTLVLLSLSHMSLMHSRINLLGSQTSSKSVNINTRVPSKGIVSLLDCDVNSVEIEKSQRCSDLNDLITSDAPLQSSNPEDEIFNQGEESQSISRIDAMIQSNITGLIEMVNNSTSITRSSVQTGGLVKRK